MFVLAALSDKNYLSVAFDAGGVASGPMTTAFLLPFAMGACEAAGGNVLTDAFGTVAMVAMFPLITVQLMGVVYVLRTRKASQVIPASAGYADTEIIELWGGAGPQNMQEAG